MIVFMKIRKSVGSINIFLTKTKHKITKRIIKVSFTIPQLYKIKINLKII